MRKFKPGDKVVITKGNAVQQVWIGKVGVVESCDEKYTIGRLLDNDQQFTLYSWKLELEYLSNSPLTKALK